MVGGRRRGPYYRPFMGSCLGDPEFDHICNAPLDYDTVLLHVVPEYIPFWKEREPDKRLIGYTVWETDRLPGHWPPLLNLVDQVLVACRWNKSVFQQCGVSVPIDVIPHLTSKPLDESTKDQYPITPEDYVFYTIGTWTARKAIWNTVYCYLKTFSASDRVVLIIKTSRRDFTRGRFSRIFMDTKSAVREITEAYPNPARILLINREISRREIQSLHRRGDCYISLCRSEGWGLGAFDAAARGKPVIITGFGGQLDYLPPEYSYLVNYRLVPVEDARARTSYTNDQHWAEPDLENASSLMHKVFEDRAGAKEKGQRLASYIHAAFDNEKTIERLISILNAG